jgi:hypothetical protein
LEFYGAINSDQLIVSSMYTCFSGVNTQCEVSRNFFYGSGETENQISLCSLQRTIKLTKPNETNLKDNRNKQVQKKIVK